MKKRGGLLLLAGLVVQLGTLFFAAPAMAAACTNVSSFGAVDLRLPELPRTDNFALWVRFQSPSDSAKVLVQVNTADCLTVEGTGLPDQWRWQQYKDISGALPITFPGKSNNTLRLIGIQSGVKVDRVLVSDLDCVPEDFGNNCKNVSVAEPLTNDQATILPSPSQGPVSGKVMLSTTPAAYKDELESVSYRIDSQVLQTLYTAEPFDTTLLENGKHSITITTTLKSGKIIRESTVIEVDNPENVLTPVIRWVRLHAASVRLVGLVLVGAAALVLLVLLVRTFVRHRRERSFHGF